MAGAPPLPNIPLLAASSNDMTTTSNETALFANLGAINVAAQLAQLNATLQALAATVAANHQTATNNHQNLLNIVAANHQTSQTSLAAINAELDLQPMRLANAATSSNTNLVGPTLDPLADPHPTKRDDLMGFTVAQCNASAAAFTRDGHTLQPLPNAPSVQDRRKQLARFLGVNLGCGGPDSEESTAEVP